jgi:hypothetical protein
MKNSSRFTIVPFLNPSGNKVYRVKGTLDGKSIRKNFKTRKEAIAFRQQLEITFLNQESEGQTIWTTLTHDQNRDAIAAVNMLKRSNSSKSLSFAVKYLLQHYKESNENILVEDAVEERIEFEFEAKIRCDVESFNRYDPYQILDRETALKDDKVEGDSW